MQLLFHKFPKDHNPSKPSLKVLRNQCTFVLQIQQDIKQTATMHGRIERKDKMGDRLVVYD